MSVWKSAEQGFRRRTGTGLNFALRRRLAHAHQETEREKRIKVAFRNSRRVTISSMLVAEKPDSENKLNAALSIRSRMGPAGYVF